MRRRCGRVRGRLEGGRAVCTGSAIRVAWSGWCGIGMSNCLRVVLRFINFGRIGRQASFARPLLVPRFKRASEVGWGQRGAFRLMKCPAKMIEFFARNFNAIIRGLLRVFFCFRIATRFASQPFSASALHGESRGVSILYE